MVLISLNKELNNLLRKEAIEERAEFDWNCKTDNEKKQKGKKYAHIVSRLNLGLTEEDWLNEYSLLSNFQKKLIFKGEVIRTYDALSSKDKTQLMKFWGLSKFSNKWHNLPYSDKNLILNYYGFE